MKRSIIHAVCITALLTLSWGKAFAADRVCLHLEYGGPSWPTTLKLILTDVDEGFIGFVGEHICNDPEGHLASSPLHGVAHPRQGGQFHVGVNTMGGRDIPLGGNSCPVSTIELDLFPTMSGLDGRGTIFYHNGGIFEDVVAVHLVACPPGEPR
ncbi:MAG: hypothetical protein HYY20_02945 [Candidatus Tectomicrobia bacterium]|uniref:Uncharacterized protein n=1 Tax=Tectimicrobiota bacterium TaxID=2528274 RepID=A0A932FUP2_UNCTE|nr:hypothetical protein [Candidatus Tectomicrobia bacterium]